MKQGVALMMIRWNMVRLCGMLMLSALLPVQVQALPLSAAQLQMVQQLPASEKAKLAQQAGFKPPIAPDNQKVPLVQDAIKPLKVKVNDVPSTLEQRFNSRLSGNDETSTDGTSTDGTSTDGTPAKITPKLQALEKARLDQDLRHAFARSVHSQVRQIQQDLKQFGYQLFSDAPTSFASLQDVPMPPEYILGPGDELRIQYYGSRSDALSLIVDREGVVELPEVGTLRLAGLTFAEMKATVSQKIRKSLTGVTVSISMGKLRSIRVFVLGDVNHPGSYLVSGLSTMSNALFSSGGVSKQGSLRHILLKRRGNIIRDLDFYDFLLHGNSTHDARLQSGDVIFVAPIGKTVTVAGEVVRPAIYELRGERTVSDILKLAGGASPEADLAHIQVQRLMPDKGQQVLDVNLRKRARLRVHDGDILAVYRTTHEHHEEVTLLGQVVRPGTYGFNKGMHVSDVLSSRDDVLDDAYMGYALIQRTDSKSRELTVLRVSLERLLDVHDISADVELQDEDRVIVLSKSAIEPLPTVSVTGQVVQAGMFPLTKKMHVVDLLLAAGGMTDHAYMKEAEITRYRVVAGEKREAEHLPVNLKAALEGDAFANVLLQPYDVLTVRQLSNWRQVEHVTLTGEVRFPGEYPVEDGEHLSDVLKRAGGYTDKAYLRAALFTRESIRKAQQEKIDAMVKALEGEVARMKGTAATSTDPKALAAVSSAESILAQMRKTKATGRLVLELKDMDALNGTDFDVRLRDGDRLYIPKRPDEVLVLGQVYNTTAMLYRGDLSVKDYIQRAGGVTQHADKGHIYVVHASGLVEPLKGSWGHKVKLYPGDAIMVPEDLEQFRWLPSLLDWSKVLYQFGTALASMRVVGLI